MSALRYSDRLRLGFMFVGDESLTPRTPIEGVTLIDRYLSIRDEASEASANSTSGDRLGGQEFSHFPTLKNGAPAGGNVSEEVPARSGLTLEPVAQGEVKSSLYTESGKQVRSNVWFIDCVAYPHCSLNCSLHWNLQNFSLILGLRALKRTPQQFYFIVIV